MLRSCPPLVLGLMLACTMPAVEVDALIHAAADDPQEVVPAIVAGGAAAAAGKLDAEQTAALAELGRRVFLSPERVPGMQRLGVRIHTVASGESPRRILDRYAMSNALMQRLNPDYDDRRLGAGAQLKVVDLTALSVVVAVDRETFRLVILGRAAGLAAPVVVADMPVGIGKAGRETPAGRARIGVKALDPEWTHPDTKEGIPPGDPRNVLGGYWIALDGPGFDGIGLHGYTGAPSDDWLRKAGSRGCLRMLQEDVDAVYDLVPEGTVVLIE